MAELTTDSVQRFAALTPLQLQMHGWIPNTAANYASVAQNHLLGFQFNELPVIIGQNSNGRPIYDWTDTNNVVKYAAYQKALALNAQRRVVCGIQNLCRVWSAELAANNNSWV